MLRDNLSRGRDRDLHEASFHFMKKDDIISRDLLCYSLNVHTLLRHTEEKDFQSFWRTYLYLILNNIMKILKVTYPCIHSLKSFTFYRPIALVLCVIDTSLQKYHMNYFILLFVTIMSSNVLS